MGRHLIEHYLLLSQEDLHLWESNPEEFGKGSWSDFFFFQFHFFSIFLCVAIEEGGEAWKYSLRVNLVN
jgi:hypothetical protein